MDCQLKLILGLIWTLILHYSISMPMWEGDENVPGEKGPTPKQRSVIERRCNDWAQPETASVIGLVTETNAQLLNTAAMWPKLITNKLLKLYQ